MQAAVPYNRNNFCIFKVKMDFNIRLGNGQILRGFIRSPGSGLRAVVILIHGLGEHIQRYRSLSELLAGKGIGFAGVDLPGHGLSDGKKGHIRSYRLTDEMIDILVAECRKTFPGTPVILYGHSMGGGILLDYLLRKKPRIKAAIVTSPWLKLSFEPERSKVKMAAIVKNIFPSLVQPSGLIADHLTHDNEVIKAYTEDPLVHDRISVSLFSEAMKAGEDAIRNAGSLTIPLLLMHGSNDMICSPEGSREFAAGTKLAELKIWNGGYHELHNELFREDFFSYLINWLNARLV
jgi:alpha-beta hydrolase superfamily lysophospholipase